MTKRVWKFNFDYCFCICCRMNQTATVRQYCVCCGLGMVEWNELREDNLCNCQNMNCCTLLPWLCIFDYERRVKWHTFACVPPFGRIDILNGKIAELCCFAPTGCICIRPLGDRQQLCRKSRIPRICCLETCCCVEDPDYNPADNTCNFYSSHYINCWFGCGGVWSQCSIYDTLMCCFTPCLCSNYFWDKSSGDTSQCIACNTGFLNCYTFNSSIEKTNYWCLFTGLYNAIKSKVWKRGKLWSETFFSITPFSCYQHDVENQVTDVMQMRHAVLCGQFTRNNKNCCVACLPPVICWNGSCIVMPDEWSECKGYHCCYPKPIGNNTVQCCVEPFHKDEPSTIETRVLFVKGSCDKNGCNSVSCCGIGCHRENVVSPDPTPVIAEELPVPVHTSHVTPTIANLPLQNIM
jgi:hypothetical protein